MSLQFKRIIMKKKKPHPAHVHHESPDNGDAFIPDVARSHKRLKDDAAESFAEEFIASVTSGEFVGEDARDEMSAEERGGPILQKLAESEAVTEDDELELI
jgi:hypothetical protein